MVGVVFKSGCGTSKIFHVFRAHSNPGSASASDTVMHTFVSQAITNFSELLSEIRWPGARTCCGVSDSGAAKFSVAQLKRWYLSTVINTQSDFRGRSNRYGS